MGRYSKRGELDDVITTNGDGGFIGFETRRHPTQLEQGVARFSQNMRFENNIATVRQGIDRITADTTVASTTFTLPSGLGTETAVTTLTSSGTTATLTMTTAPAEDYSTGDEFEIQGADQSAYNGSFTVTKVSTTVFTYTMGSDPVDTATGTITTSPILGTDIDGVFASCLFSDVDTDTEYIAQAGLDSCIITEPGNTSNTFTIEYAAGDAPDEQFEQSDNGSMTQVGNGLLINRGKRKKALIWDGNVYNSSAFSCEIPITSSGTTATAVTTDPHNYNTGDVVTMAGATEPAYNGTFTITVVSETSFTYTMLSDPANTSGGTITAVKVPQFIPVPDTAFNGFLSMPKAEFSEYHPFARLVVPVRVLEYKIKSLGSSGNIATATTSVPHGLQVGDRMTISGASDAVFNGIYPVTSKTETTFSYTISGTTDGTTGGSNKLATIDVRDMFIFSDIYDHSTYDPVTNLFRINRGKADSLVALKTWQNDNLIALYEKSVHVITGVSLPDLNLSSVFKITDEVGCLARRTVEIIGENIVFLADGGVYMLGITPELNLRGQEIPLSRDISDQFTDTNLNYAAIKDSVAVYFENRYYIAVPASGQTRNTIVYVYNFINRKWESKDTFGSANYIDGWVVCKKDGKDRLFATSLEGSIQLYEELDHDELGSSPTNTEIPSQLITRRYTMGNSSNLNTVTPFAPLESNRFMRGSVNLNVLNGDVMTITANTQDPDSTVQVASYTFTATEDHHKRFRINKRGTGCEIQIDSTVGRPEIRSISIDGTEFSRSNSNFE